MRALLPTSVVRLILALAALTLIAAGCAGDGVDETATDEVADTSAEADAETDSEPADEADDERAELGELTVYAGRSLELVGPIIERFTEATGIEVAVRDGDTAELAAQILEEGANTPADVYFAQDAGALGALRAEGRLAALDDELLDQVDDRFRAVDGSWIGISGRARTLAYNTDSVSEAELPDSLLDLTGAEWRGRVGWAPTNGSFQAFVTAMRLELGDEATREWIEGMIANDVQVFENNTSQVEAAGRGEIDVGIVNHYYLYRFLAEDPSFPVENLFLGGGDIGALINIAGVGILDGTDQPDEARAFVEFLLSEEAQAHFSAETYEYPLATGVAADPQLPPLEQLQTPAIDLSDLEDLEGTLELLRQAGALS